MEPCRTPKSREMWTTDEELRVLIVGCIEDDPSFWTGLQTADAVLIAVHDAVVTITGIVRSASERGKVDVLARALGAFGVDNRLLVDDQISGKAV